VCQRNTGELGIVGLLLECKIGTGNQKLSADFSQLEYSVSITGACIGWQEMKELLEEAGRTTEADAD